MLTFIRLCKRPVERNRARKLFMYALIFISIMCLACVTDLLVVWSSNDLPSNTTLNSLGMIGVVSNIAMFSAPVVEFSRAIKMRSTKSLSAPLALASFVCGSLWFFLGAYEMNDAYIWFPNSVGVLVSLCQLGLFVRFGFDQNQDNSSGNDGYNLVLPSTKRVFELRGNS